MIAVADFRVVARMVRRRKAAKKGHLVIGSPAIPRKPWSERQRDQAIRELYKELAQALKIETLETNRTHVWRATRNTMLVELPAKLRAEYLGHTVEGTTPTTPMFRTPRP
jgi:integrase